MKVLVVGAQGMLGYDVMPALTLAGHEVVPAGRREAHLPGYVRLDLCDREQVRAVVARVRPDAVLNAAAYTNVDGAETDEAGAYRVNALGSWNLALSCQEFDLPLLQVSTDYVFDGSKGSAYDELDPTNPQSVYGRSKRAGEMYVEQLCKRFYIVRTSWLYGLGGKNFVETILSAAQNRPELKVVNDQWGSPTWTRDLARLLVELLESGRYGIYHATGQGACTWWEFARHFVQQAGLATPILTQTTEELARPAPRPRYSVLRNRSLEIAGFTLLPSWQESVDQYVSLRHQIKAPVG